MAFHAIVADASAVVTVARAGVSARRPSVAAAAAGASRATGVGFKSSVALMGARVAPAPLGVGTPFARGLEVVSMARGRGRRGGGRGRGRGRGRRGGRVAMDRGPLRNEDIDLPEVRVIDDATKEVIGVMSSDEALDVAEEAGLDLVLMSPEADPPVCRLMNYSKYKYEQEKKQRETRKRAAATKVELKELKMRYNIDVHDYGVRLKAAKKFLDGGDRVKVICQFRGRENEFRDLGRDMFVRFVEDVGLDLGTMEGNPSMEGNRMVMTIAPVKEKSANNVSTRQERNKRKQAKKDAAAAAEDDEDDEEDEDGSYDEDDEEGSYDEEYEEEEEEVTVSSN
jgi:translation initiation factor IF-3